MRPNGIATLVLRHQEATSVVPLESFLGHGRTPSRPAPELGNRNASVLVNLGHPTSWRAAFPVWKPKAVATSSWGATCSVAELALDARYTQWPRTDSRLTRLSSRGHLRRSNAPSSQVRHLTTDGCKATTSPCLNPRFEAWVVRACSSCHSEIWFTDFHNIGLTKPIP